MEYDPSTDGERHASPDTRTADIAVTISSSKKVRVQLDLKQGLAGNLSIPPLHGLDAAAAPLTTVCFSPGMTTNLPELHVELPDDCVATTYTGVIVDADTNEPVGTLCLRVVD
jgi:hypothetical protein